MKLLLMSTPYFFIEEHQILTALFDEGLELLHLRKPDTEPILSERLLTLIPENYHRRIVTHDHFYLKNEYGLRGIHLNQRNPELPEGYKGHISCTCQNFNELQLRRSMMDYLILSPVMQEGFALTEDALRTEAAQGHIDKKVFAQGNVTLENLRRLCDLGFGGAVLFSDIWNRFNIYANQDFKEIISHFRKLQKAID